MRFRSALALVAVGALLAGCSDAVETEVVRPVEVTPTPPAYDATLEPAAAVMAVVPADATLLEVTDYDQVRLSLGYGVLSSDSEPAVRRRFWVQAERESPLLSRGLFRGDGTAPRGFTQDDVSWEARFSGPAGVGYVVKFRDDLDMGLVSRAAGTPGSPIRGATVVAGAHLAAAGATREPTESWAADPDLLALVGQKSGSTYVSRDCLAVEESFGTDAAAPDLGALDELGAFSVGFGGRLVTARLGAGRPDVFDRARLPAPTTDPGFARAFADPVADPSTGRIGFRLGDGPAAARLVQERRLPFAVCAE